MKLRSTFSLIASLAGALSAGVLFAGDPPSARLGTDAAVRLDGDDARLQFVLFAGNDYSRYLETLNEKAASVESSCSINYRFVRSSRKVVGSGRASLRASGKGVSVTHDVTAHSTLSQEVPGFILRLRATQFAGAKWTADAQKGVLPAEPKHTHIDGGKAKSFTVAFPGGRTWTLTFPKPVTFELSDLRRQDADDITFSFFCGKRLNLKSGGGASSSCVMTPSDGEVKPGIRNFHAIASGATWVKLDAATGIRPSSAFDLMRAPTRKAPAGTDGRLNVTTNGAFVFARQPNAPIRLYGCRASTQLLFADKQKQMAYTKQLAACGYNAIRLAYFDARLCVDGAKGLQCDSELVTKFDQFVTSAARDGLYVFLDPNCQRAWKWNDLGIPAPGGDQPSHSLATALCLCDERAFGAWQRLLDTAYLRKNKIGRKMYSEDAAIPLVAVVSGASAFSGWSDLRQLPFMRERYAAWLAAKRKTSPDFISADKCCEAAAFSSLGLIDRKSGSIRMFLAESEVASVAKMRDYLQKNKAKALIGAAFGQQWYTDVASLRATAGDFTCGAFSIDTPHYLGEGYTVPCRLRNVNPLLAASPVSSSLTLHERPDRAMCVTSWEAPIPSSWRAQSGLLVGAWAAKHGWDALLAESVPLNDPLAAAIERAVFALYARGDLSADAPDGAFVIEKGALTIKTPKTAGGTSPDANGRIVAAPLVAELKGARAAVWVSSLTDQPIASSRRLLLTHLTEMQQEGTLFADSRCDLLMRKGTGSHVLRDGSATIQLALEKPMAYKVFALATDGLRQTRLTTDVKDGMLTFTATVRGAKNAQYAYEIVRD